jgi:hypothetical protein
MRKGLFVPKEGVGQTNQPQIRQEFDRRLDFPLA